MGWGFGNLGSGGGKESPYATGLISETAYVTNTGNLYEGDNTGKYAVAFSVSGLGFTPKVVIFDSGFKDVNAEFSYSIPSPTWGYTTFVAYMDADTATSYAIMGQASTSGGVRHHSIIAASAWPVTITPDGFSVSANLYDVYVYTDNHAMRPFCYLLTGRWIAIG